MLNPNSPIPLYRQLADLLLAKIRSGEYPVDARIPSEHHLSRTYRIGRPTARQATDLLVRQNVLVRRRGSGTYVRPRPKEVDLFSLAGTLSSFQEKGIRLITRILAPMALKAIGKDGENPFSGGVAYRFSRIGSVDDLPVLLEEFYLDEVLFSGIDRLDLSHQSLSRIVAETYYMTPTGGKQNFRIGKPAGPRARLLDLAPEQPVLVVKRWLHFPQMQNAVYSELYCRTDRFVFSQSLGDPTDG